MCVCVFVCVCLFLCMSDVCLCMHTHTPYIQVCYGRLLNRLENQRLVPGGLFRGQFAGIGRPAANKVIDDDCKSFFSAEATGLIRGQVRYVCVRPCLLCAACVSSFECRDAERALIVQNEKSYKIQVGMYVCTYVFACKHTCTNAHAHT